MRAKTLRRCKKRARDGDDVIEQGKNKAVNGGAKCRRRCVICIKLQQERGASSSIS